MDNNIEEKLKVIFDDFGVDLIDNPFKLYAIYCDYSPNDLEERKNLKRILQSDFNLIKKLKETRSDKQMDALVLQLTDSGLDKEIIQDFIKAFSKALGIKSTATSSKKKNKDQNGTLRHNIPNQTQSNKSSTIFSPQNTRKKHRFLLPFILILILLSGYLGIGLYQTNSYISNIKAGKKIGTSFFDTIPLMNYMLNWKLKSTVDSSIKSYNKGKTDYDEAEKNISMLTSSMIKKYAEKQLALLEKLSISKQSYKYGTEQKDNENYIEAVQSLSKVIKEDSLYKNSLKLKKEIKKNFTQELISQIEDAISNTDYTSAVKLACIGGKCYPSDDELTGMEQAANDCGNPLVYQIVHNIYKDIKKVEKDKDNKKQNCYSMIVFKLNDTHFLLGALFGTVEGAGVSNYSIVCYDITPDKMSEITQNEYQSSMEGKGRLEKLEFGWNPDISRTDKEEKLYEQLIKMGPNYQGDTSGISYVYKNETPEESNSNQPSIFRILVAAGLEFLGVLIMWTMIIGCIKSFINIFR